MGAGDERHGRDEWTRGLVAVRRCTRAWEDGQVRRVLFRSSFKLEF